MATFPSKVNYATGDILTATNMNDVGGAINLLDGAQFAAGKNKIINGDFGVWQRGTSFTVNNATAYTADRFLADNVGNATVSQQTFTPGTAPVAGYEGQFFLRFNQTSGGAAFLIHRIEDVRQFAGQTITVSVYAKGASALNLAGQLRQNFGSGGSATVNTTLSTQAITTSWARYSWTVAVPSITGKTVGTSSYLEVRLDLPSSGTFTFDVWGLQAEAASTASNFQTATGTKQGELAACQRYFYRYANGADDGAESMFLVQAYDASNALGTITYPVQMRSEPTMTVSSAGHFRTFNAAATALAVTSFTLNASGTSPRRGRVDIAVASGLVAGNASYCRVDSNLATLDLSAEL